MELDIQYRMCDSYKDENRVLVGDNAVLTKSNKNLKSTLVLWKVVGISSAIVGFYMGTKI